MTTSSNRSWFAFSFSSSFFTTATTTVAAASSKSPGAQLAGGGGGGLACPKFCKKRLCPHKHGYIYGTKYFKLVCVVNLSPLINSRTIT